MQSFKFVVFVAALGLSACQSGFGSSGETIDNSPVAVGSDTDELSPESQLLGSYKATDGTLLGIVLAKQDGNFVFAADQQVWCFKAPCLPVHLEGSWAVRSGKLHLTENANKHIYEYTLAGGVLTLADPTDHKRFGTLARVETWCGRSTDCSLQKIKQPMSTSNGVLCLADQTCGAYSGDEAGFGDSCANGASCIAGLSCLADACGR